MGSFVGSFVGFYDYYNCINPGNSQLIQDTSTDGDGYSIFEGDPVIT